MSDTALPQEKRRYRRTLLWVFALAALIRLAYAAEHSGSAFFGVPVLDEKYYDTVARALAEGRDVATLNPGFRPLLYPAFVAVFYRLGGDAALAWTTLAQHLLGVWTAVLAAALAMRLHRHPGAAAAAGVIYALAGPPLFFEGEILITALFTFLMTLLLWLLSRADLAAEHAGRWLAAGCLVGVSAQARPNALLLLAAFPAAALWLRRRGEGPGAARRLLLAALPAAGAAAVLLAAAFCQRDAIGRFQWLPSAGGINLYLGNKAGADGMIPRQDRSVTYGEEYRDSVQVFAVETYRRQHPGDGPPPAPTELSRYWIRRTLVEIARDPGRWLALMGRKALLLVWNEEIPNNKSYAFVSTHESLLLRLLPVRWWLLLALAALGAVHAFERRGEPLRLWIAAFLVIHGAGILAFFVNSRYRLPMWPAMAVLAGGALPRILDTLRRRRWRELATLAAVGLTLAAVALVDWLGTGPPSAARDFFFRSLARSHKGDLAGALADARQSVELDPEDAAARFQLGNVALALGDDDLAYRGYLAAAARAPDEPRVFNNLGVLYERRAHPADAYRAYQVALSLAGDYPPALVNAALLELRAGLVERADERIRRAAAAGFDSVPLDCARAFLAQARGRADEAGRLLETARRRDPEAVALLVGRSSLRLTPEELGLPPVPGEAFDPR